MNALSVVEPVVRPQVRRGEDPHILVLGLGYVGLPTALALLDCGHQVTGLDISPDRLDRIREMDVDLIPSDLHRLDLALDEPDFVLTADVHDVPGGRPMTCWSSRLRNGVSTSAPQSTSSSARSGSTPG
ncbi:MAG: hypothetical protein IPM90_15735 [Austwickia sp.]|nr:hypothetical protein [Austwickia sp.]